MKTESSAYKDSNRRVTLDLPLEEFKWLHEYAELHDCSYRSALRQAIYLLSLVYEALREDDAIIDVSFPDGYSHHISALPAHLVPASEFPHKRISRIHRANPLGPTDENDTKTPFTDSE